MKKTKIFAISSVLLLLLSACNNKTGTSTEDKNPGFTYNTPTDTFVDNFNPTVNFDGNDVLKKLYETCPAEDDTKEAIAKWRSNVIESIDKNQIVPNKVEYSLIDKEVRNYGGLDTRNRDIETHYTIKRDENTLSKSGTFDIKKQTYSVKKEEGKDDVVIADPLLDVDGTYSYTTNVADRKYIEKFDYTDESKTDFVKEDVLTSTNLNKAMILSDLTSFKQGYKNLIDSFEPDSSTSEWLVTNSQGITRPTAGGDSLSVEFTIDRSTKPDALDPEKSLFSDIETFKVTIHKDGYVKEAYHFHEFKWKNPTSSIDPSLEKFEEKYTFSLEK